ncbi:MAG: exopolyphosphatase [Neomegalonema sp.]
MPRNFFRSLSMREWREAAPTEETRRVGVVDIGSNSVRLVVFDGAARSPSVFFNEKVLCGLGEELQTTGRLAEAGKARARAAIRRFAALSERMNLTALIAVGTAALRDAEDGPEFVARVAAETGLSIQVAEGVDEARLSAQGVLLGDPEAHGVIADLGGASMELVFVKDGEVGSGVTTPLGPLRLNRIRGDHTKHVDAARKKSVSRRLLKPPALYVLGGSWRALINAHMAQTDYPLRVLHGYALDLDEAIATAEWGAHLTPDEVRDLAGCSERRARDVPESADVLSRLLRVIRPERLVLSAFGLREGILWEHLSEELRSQDPLVQVCERMERESGRMPGFGHELWSWLSPLFPEFDEPRRRLALAVCLLADVSWRTHPDYRARSCFELVTRNTFGGVDHAERLFVGAALLFRYKKGNRMVAEEPAVARLLSAEDLRQAEALGRGVRLGAMISAAAPGVLPNCPIEALSDGLKLTLPNVYAALEGEEVVRRLEAFAQALGLPGELNADLGQLVDAAS